MKFKGRRLLLFSGESTRKFDSKNISWIFTRIFFFILGILASVWVIIQLIPKPSRANYPCMKVAFPIATSFILYLSGLFTSVLFFKKARKKFNENKFLVGATFLLAAIVSLSMALLNNNENASANITSSNRFSDPLGTNAPIGEAKGVVPGRVVWVHNPDATNIKCTNNSQSDAYWLAKNCDQAVVDAMFSNALLRVTDRSSDSLAWDAIFRYFNVNHGKGDEGYNSKETIFIKVNAVTAYNGATANGGKQPASVDIESDTTPQTILAMLKQLINVAHVPQKNIFVGDPIADLWDHMYQYLHDVFPDVNYVSSRTISNRYELTANSTPGIYYSDKGTVLTEITSHTFYKEMTDANYLINIPVMKGHRWAGITFCAKNHFGDNTSGHSYELHKGLMDGNDNYDEEGRRYDYRMYRVLVDLMGCKYLGGNTLIYFVDGLWSTSHEHQKPQKFTSSPFNNDYSSSIVLSLDPVAIESVCLDIMQKEFTDEDLSADPPRYTYVQWEGIDDYLHQAASSDWWPEGIVYDPDNTGTPIKSLGVHEHWNNITDMKYSRNLGTGNGIELILLEQLGSGINQRDRGIDASLKLFPNPVTNWATIKVNDYSLTSSSEATIYSINGMLVKKLQIDRASALIGQQVDLSDLEKGNYIIKLRSGEKTFTSQFIHQ